MLLAQRLVKKGLLSEDDLKKVAEAQAAAPSKPLHEILIERKFAQEQDVLGEAGTGSEQTVEVAGLLEFIEPAECDEDALADAALVAGILDDLQVLAGLGFFDAKEHGVTSLIRTPQRLPD